MPISCLLTYEGTGSTDWSGTTFAPWDSPLASAISGLTSSGSGSASEEYMDSHIYTVDISMALYASGAATVTVQFIKDGTLDNEVTGSYVTDGSSEPPNVGTGTSLLDLDSTTGDSSFAVVFPGELELGYNCVVDAPPPSPVGTLTDALVWYLPSFGPGSGETVTDIGSNSYDATIVPGSGDTADSKWASGGIEFDGADDYWTVPSGAATALQGLSEWTVSFWAKADAHAASQAAIGISTDGKSFTSLVIYPFDLVSGTPRTTIFFNSGGGSWSFDNDLADGQFHNFIITSQSATDHRLYVNNKLKSTGTSSQTFAADLNNITIGNWYPGKGQEFAGTLDSIFILDREATQSERLLLSYRPEGPSMTGPRPHFFKNALALNGGLSPVGVI